MSFRVASAPASGEDSLIARYFKPIATDAGAFSLNDDAAVLKAQGADIVVTTDAIVEGVHFLAGDPPDTVARKALRVNLSDLAAKGATPAGFVLTLALRNADDAWLKPFAQALGEDAAQFGCPLLGGDTVSTPGPVMISVTAFGRVPQGRMIHRRGARAGDRVVVTGTIGDAALGLLAARGRFRSAFLEKRYRLPEPRTKLGPRLIGVARATADVSDGLLADAGHVAAASGLAVHIERELVPLSTAARRIVEARSSLWANVLGGGDDYELVIAVPPRRRTALHAAAGAAGVKVTPIGHFRRGKGVRLTVDGREARVSRKGYVHF
jgi:thiamine-monophosphate kinase